MKKAIVGMVEDVLDVGAEGTVSIVCSMAAESLIGQVAPGVTTAVMAYKQKRFEKNIERFCQKIKDRQEEIDDRLVNLEEKHIAKFKNKYFPLVIDYVPDEPQEEKIDYLVNGLASIASCENLQEDFVLTYYDTLKDLRLADIDVLKFYYDIFCARIVLDSDRAIFEESELSYEQYDAIRKKLVKMGLMQTLGEKEINRLYKAVIGIQDFLQGKSKKLPSGKLPKSSARYIISMFGVNFMEFFIEKDG